MRNRTNVHTTIIIILTIVCVGLSIESFTQTWEFWVPPVLLMGLGSLWVMHISQLGDLSLRENYIVFMCFATAMFHGVHPDSFFDIAIANVLLMVTLSLLGSVKILNGALIQYFVLLFVQIGMAVTKKSVDFSFMTFSTIILDTAAVLSLQYVCRWMIKDRKSLLDEIESSKEAMKTSADDMDDFLVNISHELRTPVNVVNGISSLILKKEDTEDVRVIRDAGLKLSKEIEDILDYTEIKQGSVLVENEKYSVSSLVNDINKNYGNIRDNEEIEFGISIDPNVPAVMTGDVRKIYKIVSHLIDNAYKFTIKGSVIVLFSSNPREYGVNLVIEVVDTGIGMSRHDIASVSKGFYQANKERNRSSGGIGLGLGVVYGFAHKMDGFVTIESEPGKGTTVRVTIPQKVDDEGRFIDFEDLKQEKDLKPVFEGVKVLIVDDEPMNLVVATGMFKDYGMITETASGGREAIDKYLEKDYDIIFMDHMMPEMDGVEAMKIIKHIAKENGRYVNVVALTANAISGAKEMFLKEGFDGFIAKPLDISEFERVMKRILPDGSIRYVERSVL